MSLFGRSEARREKEQAPHSRQEQDDRRAAERAAASQGPDTQPPADVEDAVVTREHSAAGDMPVLGNGGRREAPLFSPAVAQDFRARWDATQTGFVDDPRQAVKQADELCAQVMASLAQSFADERKQLAPHLSETASTENMRVALQRYRSFLQRLLTL
jgi:hypothetical protein